MDPVTLVTARMVLSTPTAEDVEFVAEYCTDPLFERFMATPWPYRVADAEYFLSKVVPVGWATGQELTWALRSAPVGPLLGVIGWRPRLGDIGYWLGAPHRGSGLMTEAVDAVTDWIFATQSVDTIGWECFVGNLASLGVARKAGFTFTGEGPSHVVARDGGHPLSWHGVISRGDPHAPNPGWPA